MEVGRAKVGDESATPTYVGQTLAATAESSVGPPCSHRLGSLMLVEDILRPITLRLSDGMAAAN